MKLKSRFLSKVLKTNSCHLWQASKVHNGYGRFSVLPRGSWKLAHRLAYELFVGPIPEGLCVLHRCDVRACVNPDHLFLGTAKDNSDDKISKGRENRVKGTKSGRAKFSAEEIKAIRNTTGVTIRDLAKSLGVNKNTIFKIKAKQSYLDVK